MSDFRTLLFCGLKKKKPPTQIHPNQENSKGRRSEKGGTAAHLHIPFRLEIILALWAAKASS